MKSMWHAASKLTLLLLPLWSLAFAQTGKLAEGDMQLASGEYFDWYTYEGKAGETLAVSIQSDEFDPYLIILDAEQTTLFEEDDSEGAGLNVQASFVLPADGTYGIIVTSATPAETGRYELLLGGAAAAGTQPAPSPASPAAPSNAGTTAAANAAQPGMNSVTGVVLDTQGRPIEGAKVWIEPALTTGLVELRTGADGRYSATSLINVPYTAKAWTTVDYNGHRFCLRLGMPSASDYNTFVPEHGAQRNFQWQLTGVIEDLSEYNEYFGGMVRVMNAGYYQDYGNTLELTFTPTGPLIDGSTVSAFTRTLDLSRGTDVYDIPVGPYRITAQLLGSDGQRYAVQLGPDTFDTEHEALDIDWTADGTCGNGNGVDWNYLWLDDPNE